MLALTEHQLVIASEADNIEVRVLREHRNELGQYLSRYCNTIAVHRSAAVYNKNIFSSYSFHVRIVFILKRDFLVYMISLLEVLVNHVVCVCGSKIREKCDIGCIRKFFA